MPPRMALLMPSSQREINAPARSCEEDAGVSNKISMPCGMMPAASCPSVRRALYSARRSSSRLPGGYFPSRNGRPWDLHVADVRLQRVAADQIRPRHRAEQPAARQPTGPGAVRMHDPAERPEFFPVGLAVPQTQLVPRLPAKPETSFAGGNGRRREDAARTDSPTRSHRRKTRARCRPPDPSTGPQNR